MDLPIDARRAPFRQKYVDEETPMFNRWMVFGRCADTTVCVTDANNDIVVGLTQEQANQLIDARHVFVTQVLRILNREVD